MMTNTQRRPTVPPQVAIPFGILALSTSSIFIRYAQELSGSLVIAAYRLSIATLVLAPFALWKYRQELKKLGRQEITLGILAGIFLAVHFATWITSLEYTSVASSVVLVSTSSLWVALLSPITVKEPIRRAMAVGMVLALLGGVIVGVSDTCTSINGSIQCPPLEKFVQGEAFIGDMLALAGGLAAAGYLLIGRSLRGKMSLIPYIFLVYGCAAIVLVGIAAGSGEQAVGYPAEFYGWVTLMALIPQLLGHSTFNWALRYLSAVYVSITLLGEPIGSTILALVFLNEVPSLVKLFGAILILAGIIIASQQKKAT